LGKTMCQDSKNSTHPPPAANGEVTATLLDDVDPSMPSPHADPPQTKPAGAGDSKGDGGGELHMASAVVEEEGEGEEEPISDRAVVYGATGAGGLIGAVFGGPVLGLLGAGGGYYCATRPEGSKAGDAAKGLGRSTVQTYRSAKKWCNKNRVGPKMKAAGANVYQGAQEMNQKYRVSERTTNLAAGAYRATKKFNEKHDVTGKMSRGFIAGLNKLAGEKEGQAGGQQQQGPAAGAQDKDSPPTREPPAAPSQPPTLPVQAATARVGGGGGGGRVGRVL